jgi:hypothetical protein
MPRLPIAPVGPPRGACRRRTRSSRGCHRVGNKRVAVVAAPCGPGHDSAWRDSADPRHQKHRAAGGAPSRPGLGRLGLASGTPDTRAKHEPSAPSQAGTPHGRPRPHALRGRAGRQMGRFLPRAGVAVPSRRGTRAARGDAIAGHSARDQRGSGVWRGGGSFTTRLGPDPALRTGACHHDARPRGSGGPCGSGQRG